MMQVGRYVALDVLPEKGRRITFDVDARRFRDQNGSNPDWLIFYESPLPEYTDVPQPVRDIADGDYALVQRIDGTPMEHPETIYDLQDLFFVPVWGAWRPERPGPTIYIYSRQK